MLVANLVVKKEGENKTKKNIFFCDVTSRQPFLFPAEGNFECMVARNVKKAGRGARSGKEEAERLKYWTSRVGQLGKIRKKLEKERSG